MKVLIYTNEYPPFLGGLATTSHKLAIGFADSGMDLVVLAPGYSGEDSEFDRQLGARVVRIPGLGSSWIKYLPLVAFVLGWFYLLLTLSREKPDTVLFITEEAEAVGGCVPRYSFKPVVRVAGSGITTCFHGKKFTKKLMRWPLRRLYANAVRIIAVSNYTKGLLEGIGVPSEKITVIYNGVEDELLTTEPNQANIESLKETYGIIGNKPLLLTVARVLPRKGQDNVIRSMPMILDKYPETKYIVVGDGRYLESFKTLADELGVGDNVVFTGGVPHSKTVDFVDMCDLFVMPNRYWNNKVEGLPNALLEASARGKPILAGNHGGSVEAVENGVTGLLVDPESPGDIAMAIITLLDDRAKARRFGQNGRDLVQKRHTHRMMIEQYISQVAN